MMLKIFESKKSKQAKEQAEIERKKQIEQDMAILRKPIKSSDSLSSYSIKSADKINDYEKQINERRKGIEEVMNGPDAQRINSYGLEFLKEEMNRKENEAKAQEEGLKVVNAMLKRKEEQDAELQKEIERIKRESEERTRNSYLPRLEKNMAELNDVYNKWQPLLTNVDNFDEDRLILLSVNAKRKIDIFKEDMNDEYFSRVPEFDIQYKNKIKELIDLFEKLDAKALYNLYSVGINYLQNSINGLDKFLSSLGDTGISYEGAVKNMSHIDGDIEKTQTRFNKIISLLDPKEASELKRILSELINRLTLVKQMSLETIRLHNNQEKISGEDEPQGLKGGKIK